MPMLSRFIEDLDKRVKHRFQLTTDGHTAYLEPVETVLGMRVDYAMLVKSLCHTCEQRPGLVRHRQDSGS